MVIFVYIVKINAAANFEDGGGAGRWWCMTLVVHDGGGAQNFPEISEPTNWCDSYLGTYKLLGHKIYMGR